MENKNRNVDAETLRKWLEEGKSLVVLDVRPKNQREEWYIPGSQYIDAYQELNAGDYTVLDEIQIPENTKVITVCAAGRTSKLAADALVKKGIDAYSLDGGMKGWTLSWNTATHPDDKLEIIQVRRTGKGCLSYLIGSEKEAIVIDASLDTEVYTSLANEKGWKIKYAMDTHIHADHLSRTLGLAEKSKASLYMPKQDKLKYTFNKIKNGDILEFGSSKLRAIHTPGHTMDSATYFINDKYLFTGDTLFTDGIGRPDLKTHEEEARERASLLYLSLQNLIRLNNDSMVFPGHTSKPVPFDQKIISSSLHEIRKKVSAFNISQDEFVKNILSKIPPTPPNYLAVTAFNISGDLKGVDPKEVEAGANRCAIS